MATYYVATDGSDAAAGSLVAPWLTITYGVSQVDAGDTLYIRGGTYYESVYIYTPGSAGNIITIQAYNNEPVNINGEYLLPEAGGGDPAYENPVDDRFARYGAMVSVDADYITINDIGVRHSLGSGVGVGPDRDHVVLHGLRVAGTRNVGIIATDGDDINITNCDVSDSGNFAPIPRTGPYAAVAWPGLISLRRCTNSTVDGCTVHEGWGEGIAVMDCSEVVVSDNVVYDCYAVNVYVDRSTNVDLLRNLVYCSNRVNFLRDGDPMAGIVFTDENYASAMRCSNINIINNLVYGCIGGIQWWAGYWAESGVINSIIAHNTVSQCTHNMANEAYGITIGAGTHANSVVRNNVIYQPAHGLGLMSGSGVTWDHNVWSSLPDASVRGTHDVNADPKLLLSGSVAAGALARGYFVPRSDSPAIGAGVAQAEVPYDYDGRAWGAPPDCGAFGCYPVLRARGRRR